MTYTHLDITSEEFINKIKSLPKNIKILEIGAGNGGASKWFRELGFEDWTGVDNFSQQYRDPSVLQMDAHDLKFPDNSFDLVFLCHTAEHFVSPLIAFNNIFRVLKKGGKVIMVTPYPCEHQILKGDDSHYFVLSELQWIRILKSCGFEKVTSQYQTTYKGEQIPLVQDYMVWTEGIK